MSRAERVGRAPGPNERLVALGDGAGRLQAEGDERALWYTPVEPVTDTVAERVTLRVEALAPFGEHAVLRGVVASSGEVVFGVTDRQVLGRTTLPASAIRFGLRPLEFAAWRERNTGNG